MANANTITGQRFGRIVILKDRLPGRRVSAACDCGMEFSPLRSNVLRGLTSSCGCARSLGKSPKWKHGKSPTWRSWHEMMRRCYEQTNHAYGRYGAAGIAVSARWHSFDNFLTDMGERPPGLSIDRIDNTKGYEPGNCRWADYSQQSRNRCISVKYIADGITFDTQRQLALHMGVSQSRISQLVAEGRIRVERLYP